ncbi:MAG TPA: vanadium-dependent haloperoxidase [Vicinamibacterales bacterium]|nr:vanadium-dependent haloperoxidase [Vicinamibacterales bacterium]
MKVLRFVTACAVSSAALTVQLLGAPVSHAEAPDPVILWNRTLLAIVRTPGAQPATIHPTRSFAMLHIAIYDAVNAIDQTHESYAVRFSGVSGQASQTAAADAAAHDVLVALYPPLTSTLDATLQQSLALVDDGVAKTEGIRIGQAAAQAILSLRSNDGANQAPVPYVFGTAPGDYQSTPPNFPKQPQFTHWRNVTPFALKQADQFRPGPPPALTSDRYGDDVDEVQSFGVAGGTAATPDEALTGRFWNGAIQNYWNEIAQTASLDHHLTTPQNARLFALLNLSFADSVIAFYDAKYTYNRWRPVTAIRAAGTVDNPDVTPDANWLPEVANTPPDPAYPGAHAVISAAAASVLVAVLHRDRLDFAVTSEVLPGVTRSFGSISAAADEATQSRIFAGVHFRNDLTTGHRLGRDVADFVLDHFLTPRRGHDDDNSK